MKEFGLLFKTLYRNNKLAAGVEIKKNGRKKLPQSVVMFLGMLPLVLLICALMGFFASGLKSVEEIALLLTSIVSGIQLMLLFLMLVSIINTLYNSPDNAFLSALPLKPTSVFFAKFLLVYVSALKFSALLIIPLMLTMGITYAATGHALFYGFYPLVFLVWLALPMLPLFIVALISMPAVWIGSFFKGRSALKTLLSIVFYLGLMAAYFYFIFAMPSALGALSTLGNIMYPDKALVFFVTGIEAGKNFGIALAFLVGFALISGLLSLSFYRRIIAKQSEAHAEVSKRAVTFKRKSPVVAYMQKDLKTIVRTPSLALGALGNLLLAPVLLIAFYFLGVTTAFTGGAEGEIPAIASEMGTLGFVMFYSLIFFSAANMLSLQAFTREGESFFNSRPLPIRPKDVIRSKLILASAVPFVCALIVFFLLLFLYKVSVLSAFLYIIVTVLACIGVNSVNILFDMKNGNVHWKTASDLRAASKNNPAMILAMLISMVPGIAFLVMGILFSQFYEILGETAVMGIFWGAAGAFAVVITIIGLYLLNEKGPALYEKIGENRKTVSSNERISRFGGRGKGGMLG